MAAPCKQRTPRSLRPWHVRLLVGLCAALLLAVPAGVRAQNLGSSTPTGLALRGDIYFLEPGTSRLPDFAALKRQGTVYVSQLNVTPRSFRSGFPGVTERFEWFAIDYRGRFSVARSGLYRFRLTSDDGAVLIVDGDKVIDNDGVHGPRSREGRIELRRGMHDIRVQYFQGPATEIALVLEAALADAAYAIFPTQDLRLRTQNWWEVVMDTTTVIAAFALLAFMVERLTNGLALALGYSSWWQQRMEISGTEDPAVRSRNERNRRVALFALGVIIAVPGAMVMGIDIVSQLQLPQLPALAGEAVTGLLIASGADPIREFVRSRELRTRNENSTPRPIQVAGTLVVQQPPTSPNGTAQ